MVKLPEAKQAAEAQKGAWLSIFSYLILSVTKCWIGVTAKSQGLFADGLNNVSDILLSVAILIGLRVAVQPADKNHPFGHSKAETVATLVAASFMVLVALEVWIGAIEAWLQTRQEKIDPDALVVSLLAALVMFLVSSVNFALSRKTKSEALKAAAHDNRSDAFVSLGAAAGIVGTNWGWAWMDPLAAFVVGLLILRTGYEVGKPAIDVLMDGFDEERTSQIEERVIQIKGIREVKELRARNQGSHVFVELTVGVDAHLSVEASHRLTERVEDTLIGFAGIAHVHVHVEPVEQPKETVSS
ncbi:cation diffusion facilitator family transporter [Laceyella putida]|uniref:Cation diffusion facilitator family transporter n=1 Tax=Laceyella putida TaxID=110101 RepID=A0ABW2RKT7_9BACL